MLVGLVATGLAPRTGWAEDGTVAFAMQWAGDPADAPALLGLHIQGGEPRLLRAPQDDHRAMRGYAGSIAITGDGALIAITSPEAGLIQVFDALSGAVSVLHSEAEVCGVVRTASGEFAFTSRQGSVGTVPTPRGNRAPSTMGWLSTPTSSASSQGERPAISLGRRS